MVSKTITALFLGIEILDNLPILHYLRKGEQEWALLDNREIPGSRLLPGSEITIALTGDRRAELIFKEEDLLPREFIDLFIHKPPVCRSGALFLSDASQSEGRYYALIKGNGTFHRLCTGGYSIEGDSGVCAPVDREWKVKYGLTEHYLLNRNWPDGPEEKWICPPFRPDESADYLTLEDLTQENRDRLAENNTLHDYCSDDWSPQFYRAQAELGFIAVTGNRMGKRQLLPELQEAYALLDWENLRIDRKVAKILKNGRMERDNIRLIIEKDPSSVLQNLRRNWKEESWLSPEYTELISRLASQEERRNREDFRIWAVTLTAGEQQISVAGELGYSVGKTYTSLSGFFRRDLKEYSNFGKLQMVLLAEVLKEAGIAFWNLGHPYMTYKTDMGAVILPRKDFLSRWDDAVKSPTPDLSALTLSYRGTS